MFDVLVWNDNSKSWNTIRTKMAKRDAKRLVKDYQQRGKKAQLKTTIGEVALDNENEVRYTESYEDEYVKHDKKDNRVKKNFFGD